MTVVTPYGLVIHDWDGSPIPWQSWYYGGYNSGYASR